MKAWLRTPWVGVVAFALAGGASLANAKDNIRLVVLDEPYMRFPLAAQDAGIYSGDVQVIVSIDPQGRVADSLLVGYTHTSLAKVVRDALPRYRFKPVVLAGEPSLVRIGLTFNFSISGLVISQTALESTQARFRLTADAPYVWRLAQTLRELDQPLAVRRSVPPPNVPGAGTVTLDFYVDESGRARLPAVRSGEKAELAEAATAALLQWEFAPPTRRGEPVVVRVSQQFVFKENG
jgi:TonB family protein